MSDRLPMAGAMSAEAAERLSDVSRLHDAADKEMLQQARDDLTEKLKSGKQVGHCTMKDLLDCELQDSRYEFRLLEIFGIFDADTNERSALIDTMYSGLIERYLDSHPDLIEERAFEMMAEDDGSDAAYDSYMARQD